MTAGEDAHNPRILPPRAADPEFATAPYLYRAVTSHGDTLDFYLSTRRNTQAAKRFLAKTLRSSSASHVPPRVINTDKNFALAAAIIELRADGRCAASVQHRRVKHLNNSSREITSG